MGLGQRDVGRAAMLGLIGLALAACDDGSSKESAGTEQGGGETASDTEASADEGTAEGEGSAEPSAQAGGEDLGKLGADELGKRMVGFYEEMAAAAKEAGGDCDKAAKKLEKVIEDNEALLAQAKKKIDKNKKSKEKFDKKYGDKTKKVMGAMVKDLESCTKHEGIKKAFAALE